MLKKLMQSCLSEPEIGGEGCWCPQVDVYRADKAWLLKFNLAGVRANDIEVVCKGRQMVVRGVRRDATILEGQQAYSMEISYNRFSRTVNLPLDCDQATITSDYRDGMFLVTIRPQASCS